MDRHSTATFTGQREADPDARGLLDAIEQHDEELAARPRVPFRARRSRGPMLIALAVLFVASSAWHIAQARSGGEFSPAEREADALFSVLVAIDAIEAHREETGALPPSLAAVEAEADGLEYEPLPGAYHLYLSYGSGDVTYASGEPVEPLERRLLAQLGDEP